MDPTFVQSATMIGVWLNAILLLVIVATRRHL